MFLIKKLNNLTKVIIFCNILNSCQVIYIDPPYDHRFEIIKNKILDKINSNILIIYENDNLIELDNLILKKQYKNKNLFFFRT